MKKYNTNDYKGPVYVEYFLDEYSDVNVVNEHGEILLMKNVFFDHLNGFFNDIKREYNVVEVNDLNAFEIPEDAYMLSGWYDPENPENEI